MRGSNSHLLAAWENGLAAGQLQRALLLHALTGLGDALELTVGQRDRHLFALRRRLFGERLSGRLSCPECATEQEFDFDVANVLGQADAGEEISVEEDGWRVLLRPLTSADLLAAAADPREARNVVLSRCVRAATHRGVPVDVLDLPSDVVARVAAAIATADALAEVRITLPCVECGQSTVTTVDIVSFLWAELDAWARSLLLDVHVLAAAYGWTEPDVLALSPTRRRYYLELVGHG